VARARIELATLEYLRKADFISGTPSLFGAVCRIG